MTHEITVIDEIQGVAITPYYRVGVYRCDAYPDAVFLREILNNATREQEIHAYDAASKEMQDDRAA